MGKPFQVISEETPSKTDQALEAAGIRTLMLGLGALSQRTIIALSRLFVLLATASAFVLWWSVLPNPSILQLVGLAMYGVFVLVASVIVRKL